MSRTFSLVCHETKQSLWVGQSGGGGEDMVNFYSGMPDVMQRLGRFLNATRGKPLVLLCDDSQGDEFEGYEEFDDPDA